MVQPNAVCLSCGPPKPATGAYTYVGRRPGNGKRSYVVMSIVIYDGRCTGRQPVQAEVQETVNKQRRRPVLEASPNGCRGESPDEARRGRFETTRSGRA